MIYTSKNSARGAMVFDLDARQPIGRVLSLDDKTGEVVCLCEPFELSAAGDLATQTIRFQAVWPIFGGYHFPQLFHCHGREVAQ